MTLEQATKLVQKTLRKTESLTYDAGPRKQLKSLGLTGPRFKSFKIALLHAVQSKPRGSSIRQLTFSESSTLLEVARVIFRRLETKPAVRTDKIKKIDLDRLLSKTTASRRSSQGRPGSAIKKSTSKKTTRRLLVTGKGRDKPIPTLEKLIGRVEKTEGFPLEKLARPSAPIVKVLAKKAVAKKAVAKKVAAQKMTAKKAVAKKAMARKAVAKKAVARKASAKTTDAIRAPTKAANTSKSSTQQVSRKRKNLGRIHFNDSAWEAPFEVMHEVPSLESAEAFPDIAFVIDEAPGELESPVFASAEGSPPSELVCIECTPQMELEDEINPGLAHALVVFLDQSEEAAGAEVQKARIQFARGVSEVPIEVWFDCSKQIRLDGIPENARVTLDTETGCSDRLRVTLRLSPGGESPLYVTAFFRHNGRPCGKITRFLERSAAGLQWAKPNQSPSKTAEITLPKQSTNGSVAIEINGIPADIRIEVLKTDINDGRQFSVHCTTAKAKLKEPWNLPQESRVLVDTYMQGFMASTGNNRISKLRGAGIQFWKAVPQRVRDAILDAIEGGSQSMAILSEEPYIPWELMVPFRRITDQRKPLGVELRVGRWIAGNYNSPRQTIRLDSINVISPTNAQLANGAKEIAFLRSLWPSALNEIVPANYDGLDAGLKSSVRDIVHFICHGTSATIQTLELESPDTLDCSQVVAMDGFRTAFKDGGFAFLNACQVGQAVLTLDGVGGFANSFIELGASGVIAPLWSVDDSAALIVSTMFYPDAKRGCHFSEIIGRIRAKAYSDAVDSFAAYCFYGDPNARMV